MTIDHTPTRPIKSMQRLTFYTDREGKTVLVNITYQSVWNSLSKANFFNMNFINYVALLAV